MFHNNRQNDVERAQTTSRTMISIHFPNHNSHIRETLECIFDESGKFGDVLLKVGPNLREFRCHRTILAFSSDFLNKLLSQTHENWKEPVIILPEFDPDIIHLVLTYIYTGELNIMPGMINGFIDVCTLLEIKGIVDQQYKLLDLIETSNDFESAMQLHTERKDIESNEKEIEEYMVDQRTESQEPDEEDLLEDQEMDGNDMPVSDEEEEQDSLMEEEYVLEEDTPENTQLDELSSMTKDFQGESSVVKPISGSSNEKLSPPLKKVRLKDETLAKTKQILRLEKLDFRFNEVEGHIGSWKHARLLTDGTANINAANALYFKERLEVCTAKIYKNVPLEEPYTEKYRVRVYFCADPVRLKAMVECLLCEKSIQVSYKFKNGKFKQWINSNVLRHVETIHKGKEPRKRLVRCY